MATHEDIAVVMLHPFLEIRLSEQVGEEVGYEVGEEVSIIGRGEFGEAAKFEVDLLAVQHSVEQDEVATGLGEGHLVEVLTLLYAPT